MTLDPQTLTVRIRRVEAELNPLALEALENNQRQLDIDGVEVGVSRQALDELLSAYKAAVDRVNRATDAEIGGIHRSLASAPEMRRVVRLYCDHDKMTDAEKVSAIANHPYFASSALESRPVALADAHSKNPPEAEHG